MKIILSFSLALLLCGCGPNAGDAWTKAIMFAERALTTADHVCTDVHLARELIPQVDAGASSALHQAASSGGALDPADASSSEAALHALDAGL